jgi:kinetochore protein Mis12/MTW1
VESITLQRRKFQETQRLHRILHSEIARNNAIIKQLKALLSPPANPPTEQSEPSAAGPAAPYPALAFLQNKASLAAGTATTPLSTTTAFALSQLPALKALLAELRPQMKTLAQPSALRDPNLNEAAVEKSWRRERLEYVESQTRRLQVNARGLELGQQGEVRDGEWQEQGRSLAKGEVDALERIVAMVSGKTGDDEEMNKGT